MTRPFIIVVVNVPPDRVAVVNSRNVNDVLKQMRVEFGLTQYELAQMMGYDNSFISRVERGLFVPSDQFLERFCSALELADEEAQAIFEAVRGKK